jgi:hypothetical protein
MKALLTSMLILLVLESFGQMTLQKPVFLNKTSIDADAFIGYDKFDFLYFIKNNTLHKSKNGELFTYKNFALGKITKVDLLNPLKVIVFYERFNTVVTLDNQLNETLKINFSEIKTPLVVSKIGISAQNQLWVFDEITRQIYLYDTGNGTLKSVGTPISEEIIFYNSDFNGFEWLDQKNNWYQCSVFGTVEKLDYQLDSGTVLFSNAALIFYKKNGKVLIFNRKSKETIEIENSDKTFESLTYKNQILSIFTNQGISNYKITIP